jgi:hypothetical protein
MTGAASGISWWAQVFESATIPVMPSLAATAATLHPAGLPSGHGALSATTAAKVIIPGHPAGHGALAAAARMYSLHVAPHPTGHGALSATTWSGPFVLYDAIGPGSYGNATSFSFTHTATTGAYVALDIATDRGGGLTTVPTYAGTNMVLLASVSLGVINSGLGAAFYQRYGLANVPGGAQTVAAATLPGGPWYVANTISYKNVVAVGTSITTAFATGTAMSQGPITCSPPQWILQGFGSSSPLSESYGSLSGGTSRYTNATEYVGMSFRDALATTTFAGTITSTNPTNWAAIATPLIP